MPEPGTAPNLQEFYRQVTELLAAHGEDVAVSNMRIASAVTPTHGEIDLVRFNESGEVHLREAASGAKYIAFDADGESDSRVPRDLTKAWAVFQELSTALNG